MRKYVVTYRIEIEAEDPVDAIERRRESDDEPVEIQVEDVETGKRYEVDTVAGTYCTVGPRTKPPADCVDVSTWPQLGPYKVKPPGAPEISIDGKDYRDGIYPIWSVGRCDNQFEFEVDGISWVAPAGTVLLSRGSDLYQREGVECLWLR